MKLRLATIGLLCVLYCQTVQPPEPTPLEKSIQTLLGQYRGPQNVSLAILPFRDEHGQESAAARMIYSALGTACFRDGRFRLLERDKIIQVLDEQSLAQSGLIDEQSAARLGRLIGARVLLLFDVKQNIVNMRITDVETAEIYSITDYSEGIINEPGRLLEQDNMVLLPAGNFIMGDGASRRRVYMTHPFYLDKYEVTNRDYRRCVAAGKCQASETDLNPFFNKPEQPVLGVTWTDAYNYCRFVDKYLPTEAQWEYAAKAGTDAPRYFELSAAGHYENLRRFQHVDVFVATAPVGTFRPNPWGLHDMLGNVSEWVFDPYDMEGVYVDPFEDNTGLTFEGDQLYRYASGKVRNNGPGRPTALIYDAYNKYNRVIKGGDWWMDRYTSTSINRVESLILYSISGSDDAGIIQLANGCPRMNVFVSDTSTDPFKCSMGRIEINLNFNPHILFKPERENAMTLNQFLASSNLWDQASINRFYAFFDNAFSLEAGYLLFDGVKPGFRCAKD